MASTPRLIRPKSFANFWPLIRCRPMLGAKRFRMSAKLRSNNSSLSDPLAHFFQNLRIKQGKLLLVRLKFNVTIFLSVDN